MDESERGLASTVASGDRAASSGSESTADTAVAATVSPAAVDAPLALRVVDRDSYTAGDEIARGGMGRIRVARDRRHGRDVAIKEVLGANIDLRRFEREALITARLQHPSIIPVYEAGTWPDGRPFYAMRLVQGVALDRAIAAASEHAERLALLPHVIAAVEAVAYAHEQGVIHRDLKPANVLVGAFGETVVIDWGLAKDLRAPDEAPPAPRPSRTDLTVQSTDLTLTGAMLGTPVYMPPEQARGDDVDARADVYSLGALLYHVLAGRPPFAGAASVAAVVETLIASGPPRLRDIATHTPRDLLAIVDKAMAHVPADRYPSARELAADLRRFQAGQLVDAYEYGPLARLSRWVRKHRVLAASVVAIATVSVVAFVSITRARDRAERSLKRSDEAAHFMLTTLREQLEPLGQLELLDRIAEQTVTYYAGRARDEGALGPVGLTRYASALRLRGDVELQLGHSAKARELFERALVTLGTTSGPDAHHERISVHVGLATLHQRQTEFEAALVAARAARELAATAPTDPIDRLAAFDVIAAIIVEAHDTGWSEAASIEREGREAIAQLRAAVDTSATAADPDVALYAVRAHQHQADLDYFARREPEATRAFQASADLARSATERWPQDTRFVFLLAYARWGLDALGAAGFDENFARVLNERLARLDTRNALWRAQLARIAVDQATNDEYLGHYESMLQNARRADELAHTLLAEEPANLEWNNLVAKTAVTLASAEFDNEQYDRALATARTALVTAERMARQQPALLRRRVRVASLHEVIGNTLTEQGKHIEAIAAYRLALPIREETARTSTRADDAAFHVELLYSLARAELAARQPEAVTHAEAATAIADAAAARLERDDGILANRRGTAYDVLAEVRLERGDVAGAREAYRRALTIAEVYVAAAPSDALRVGYVAWSELNLAKVEAQLGNRRGARELCDRAVARVRALAARAIAGDDQIELSCRQL